MKKLVVVGNGMAGVHCIEEILKINQDLFEITIFGAEPHVNYNRILLSSVLQGSTALHEITIHERAWYEQNQINLYTGEKVTKVDVSRKMIRTDQNRQVPYDKLIIATGSNPFQLPIPGIDNEGVLTFRTIEDCEKMIAYSKQYNRAVVIGGGVLGLEAARGLLNLGLKVEVIHRENYLMERQLDQTASKLLQQELEKQGMKFLLQKETAEIVGDQRVERVRFKDGSSTHADLVVMAVGVKPNIELAKESGINTNRAIVVNDYLQTSIPDVYAVGECVEHRGMVYGLVKPLYEQGKALAKHICQLKDQGYRGSVLSTQLKISGVEVFSIGQITEDAKSKSLKVFDDLDNTYKKLVFQENKLVGAVLIGNTKEANLLTNLIGKEKDISGLEKVTLLQSLKEPAQETSPIDTKDIVCHCNQVSKGAIVKTVQTHGITTVEEIKQCTNATGTCGGCKQQVSELLSYINSQDFKDEEEIITMCACTSLTEEAVVKEIQFQGLSSIEEVINVLNWRNKKTCSICLPALHYYLGMIYSKHRTKENKQFINIKTCAQEELCGCNKQAASKLADDLIKLTRNLLTPSTMKIGISACIHNGADSTTKDIGLIQVNHRWEIYVGGSSGRDVRAGELLCIAETKDEATQLVCSFIQYYRGTANFLERSWKWIERIGLVHIREVLFLDENRRQLLAQLNSDISTYKMLEKTT